MLLHKFVQSEVQLSGSLAGVGECILVLNARSFLERVWAVPIDAMGCSGG